MTAGVAVCVPSGPGPRGGNDIENKGSGSEIGCGVAVGSERAGGVLESHPSSPKHRITTHQFPQFYAPIIQVGDHSRLKTRPLARAAKRREETITLENMIFEERSCDA